MTEYYTPRDITFQRQEIIWLIEHLNTLESGEWPVSPVESGYTEIRSPNRNHKAYFETPCQIAAELTWRLKRTGESGEILVWEIQHGLDDYDLLSPPAKRALNYCSGWRRRTQEYSKWLYKEKGKKIPVENELN